MARYTQLADVDWLREHYVDQRLSTIEIAEMVGASNASVVRKALVRAEIPLRTISEARSREFKPAPTHTEKACTKCGETKPLREFHLNKKSRDGRQSWCKRCTTRLSNDSVIAKREEAVAFLGAVCVWPECGITDIRILTLDHINGGGYQERKAGSPYAYYKSVLTRPDEFQVLCWNHQHIKRLERGEHRRPVDPQPSPTKG